VAQILRHDQIGRQRFEHIAVHGVQTLAARDVIAYQAINLRGAGAVWQTRVNHGRLRLCARREIAFVANADNLSIEPQCEQHFRGRR
jgi:hypothetical protein